MNELRTQIQTALSAITTIDVGAAIPDSLVQEGRTYFSNELEERYVSEDFNKQNVMQVIFTGRIVRRESSSENTLLIIDEALEKIKKVLKDLNFDYSYHDVSAFTDGFKKIAVEGSTRYYEAIKTLI